MGRDTNRPVDWQQVRHGEIWEDIGKAYGEIARRPVDWQQVRHGAAGAVDVRVAAGPHEADVEERVACS